MNQNLSKPEPTTTAARSAVVISLAEARERRAGAPDADTHRAADALARFRAGQAEFSELLAALVAPFNRDGPPSR